MYRKHFGLARHPFAKDLAVKDLFASAAVTELEVRLRHLLDLPGIGLVTGEPGGGKTTICRKVVASLHSGLFRVFYVPLSLPAIPWLRSLLHRLEQLDGERQITLL